MDWFDIILLALPPLILFGIGYLIRFKKAYWLISGYNTMPAAKKLKVDTAGLGHLIGNMCFIMGAVMLVGILLIYLEQAAVGFIVLGCLVPVIIYILIAAQKYDGNNFDETGRMKTGARNAIGAIVAGLLLLFSFVGYLIYQGFQPTSIVVDRQSLTINGSYGQSIPVQDIVQIELIDTLPHIELRTNGSAIGSHLRGHFRVAEIGPAMLYLDAGKPPFIAIETAGQRIYLNLEEPEQTRDLFNELEQALNEAS